MIIRIDNQQKLPVDKTWMKSLIKHTLKEEGIKGANIEISILLADDKGVKKINKEYLRRPRPTDVISFRMWEGPFDKLHDEILGDVVVNVEQAKRCGKLFKKELALYVVHGLLHLLGYIDDIKTSAEQMQERCDHIMKGWL